MQQAVRHAFAVHWNMIEPFAYDDYIAWYYERHPRRCYREWFRTFAPYVRPEGCASGDGQTPACCAYGIDEKQRASCAEYGKRQGDIVRLREAHRGARRRREHRKARDDASHCAALD